jgi:hypothetical protein
VYGTKAKSQHQLDFLIFEKARWNHDAKDPGNSGTYQQNE